MTFSLRTILVALLLAGAFLAGWILPPPNANTTLTPVLLAVRDIPERSVPRAQDFRTVYRQLDEVPDQAVREFSQLKASVTTAPVRCNDYLFLDQILPSETEFYGSQVPAGKKVVAIKLAKDFDQLALYLLSSNDIVSVHASENRDSEERTCLIPRCSVFAKPDDELPAIVGLVLSERESQLVYDARKRGVQISIAKAEQSE